MLKILKGKQLIVHKHVWYLPLVFFGFFLGNACLPPHVMILIEDMIVSLCSYVVGSPGQQMPELDRQDRPVTLEYQNIVEQQMTEVK